jgi:isopenicillin-N N-acyltransferase-like protein
MQKPLPSPLVEVSGTPIERGRQYGEQARERVRRGIEHYSEQLAAKSLTWDDIRQLAMQFEPMIVSFDPNYTEEMKGIAEGAAVDYVGIMMLNARTEILKLGERQAEARGLTEEDEDPEGCTGVVALPSACAEGQLIHAQNWDWKAECTETTVVLKVRQKDGPDYLTFTEAGALARSGMNSAGISITANYLESDRDYRISGVPLALIRRKVLEQSLVGRAMHVVYTTTKSCSNNMMVAHCGGVAIDFECAPDETFQVLPRDGLMVHANHFQSPVALAKLREKGVNNMPDSLYRDIRVDGLLRPALGRISRNDVVNALLDDYQTPWSVCRPPRPSMVNNLTATVATIVMEPEAGRMAVAMLPALCPEFTSYSLDVEIRKAGVDREGAVFL